MKRIKIVLLTLLLLSPLGAYEWDDYNVFAQYMGYERDYATALAKARKAKKDLLVIHVNDGCPFCHKLIDKILTKKYVREYLTKKYVKLLVNRDQDKNIPKKLIRPYSPVTYVIDPKSEQIIDEIDGWKDEENYLWHL